MNALNQIARPVKYALLCAISAGIIGTVMINSFIEMLSWLFVPSVSIMVFVTAYFAFRRQLRGEGKLTPHRILLLSLEVGSVSHLYTFALYLPLNFFLLSQIDTLSPALIFGYLIGTLSMSLLSIFMFIWVAVPLYLGIGYLVKFIEEPMTFDESSIEATSLDDGITVDRVYRNGDLDF